VKNLVKRKGREGDWYKKEIELAIWVRRKIKKRESTKMMTEKLNNNALFDMDVSWFHKLPDAWKKKLGLKVKGVIKHKPRLRRLRTKFEVKATNQEAPKKIDRPTIKRLKRRKGK
jgi:hypothetical protein